MRVTWAEFVNAVERMREAVAKREMADLTENATPASLEHYGFNEWGTWGYCSCCQRQVTLDEDGFMGIHEFPGRGDCPGKRKRPDTQPSPEVTITCYPHLPPSKDGND